MSNTLQDFKAGDRVWLLDGDDIACVLQTWPALIKRLRTKGGKVSNKTIDDDCIALTYEDGDEDGCTRPDFVEHYIKPRGWWKIDPHRLTHECPPEVLEWSSDRERANGLFDFDNWLFIRAMLSAQEMGLDYEAGSKVPLVARLTINDTPVMLAEFVRTLHNTHEELVRKEAKKLVREKYGAATQLVDAFMTRLRTVVEDELDFCLDEYCDEHF